ncbi:MAG: S1 RNA-binding domain-containing protein [Clostridia bacterium]|nr:S1 RNA-binding domain-containing protein [Clostridia bacterium]
MQIEVGQIVEGKVTGITNFGVFVDLGDGKSGLVHISEIAQTYVSDVREHVKENDTVKMKVLNISDDGKISLSIKKAQEQQAPKHPQHKFGDKPRGQRPPKREPDYASPAAVWTPKKSESASFEDMMAKFKQTSDEKFSDLKKKNPDTRRPKRPAMK